MPEYALLNNVIDYMEKHGKTYKCVNLNINEKLLTQVNQTNKKDFTLEELKKAADKCLAHGWLINDFLGNADYQGLQITPKGIGVARSDKPSPGDQQPAHLPGVLNCNSENEDCRPLIP